MEAELIRAMRVVAMTNEDRMQSLDRGVPTGEMGWFLKNMDELAPELHARGWVRHEDFDHQPGAIVVTDGSGPAGILMLVATPLGRSQLNAAVMH